MLLVSGKNVVIHHQWLGNKSFTLKRKKSPLCQRQIEFSNLEAFNLPGCCNFCSWLAGWLRTSSCGRSPKCQTNAAISLQTFLLVCSLVSIAKIWPRMFGIKITLHLFAKITCGRTQSLLEAVPCYTLHTRIRARTQQAFSLSMS